MTLQTSLRLEMRPRIGSGFCLQWALIMTAFTLLTTLGIDGVERPIVKQAVSNPLAREELMVLGLAVCVATLGIAQGLVLRRYLDGAIWTALSGRSRLVGAGHRSYRVAWQQPDGAHRVHQH
jgi:ABC-type Fe3+ transport system permease subunit